MGFEVQAAIPFEITPRFVQDVAMRLSSLGTVLESTVTRIQIALHADGPQGWPAAVQFSPGRVLLLSHGHHEEIESALLQILQEYVPGCQFEEV
jgi:hypothetical protein